MTSLRLGPKLPKQEELKAYPKEPSALFGIKPTILNRGPSPPKVPDASISEELYQAVGRLMEEAKYDPVAARLDYGSLTGSEAYRAYTALSAGLKGFDPSRLTLREERLAFWINLYNCLIIHGIIELGVKESVREVSWFFNRIAYNIGGWVFSPDDIEHGILRGNSRHPYGPWKPFRLWDGRRSLVVEPLDPRIHFALVCGASSCPAIGAYNPEMVDEQLTFATLAFINNPAHVSVEPEEGLVRISQIFKWYERDFGGSRQAVLSYVLRFMDPSEKKDWLEAEGEKATVEYLPYQWLLNA